MAPALNSTPFDLSISTARSGLPWPWALTLTLTLTLGRDSRLVSEEA